MKTVALLLVVLSFLLGAFLSVLDPREVDWALLVPVLVIGLIGLVLLRKAQRGETQSGQRLSGDMQTLRSSLDAILANLESIDARPEPLPVYEARFEIDRLFRDDLNSFAEARESMIHVFGMQNYADVMSNFAAGERYINRVWSASTDGYEDEVRAYLVRALDQFREAHRHFCQLQGEFASAELRP
ncbi:MAG: hypothetical protein KJO33_03370 [Gammaproteobacteria bacterium]|nr:hypothetical protein [Gammaproteobacteria bacterium]